ncbi:peptidoglycan bridge formation glycyltransferase FemA/FemB family protein [Candidatus Gottesmanbacteria bacterium]|nr:peptidoglycan bridge formation glycyltransferase FemA/FemB family protein [Candidatus Gottesmanbacteria bacterium]
MEIQQSPLYAEYIRSLGWSVELLDGMYIFIRPFPFIGGLAKIQRTLTLPDKKKFTALLEKYHVKTIVIEPDSRVRQSDFSRWCRDMGKNFRINTDPYIPTKTIRVSLTGTEDEIFSRFTEAKQRAVRRAAKAGVTIRESSDVGTMIRLKNKSAGFMGFITTAGISKLWKILPAKNKTILLAYAPDGKVIGSVFLIYCRRVAYYWIAGAVPKGKKLFAPTLLVWEAFKTAKKQSMHYFDFVGAWDERIPDKNTEWKGFTKFKEGFGGNPLYYPLPKSGN